MVREPQGRFQGMPYNVTRPAREDLGRGMWDRNDERIRTPKNYGWGYTVNVAALARRLTGR